MSEFHVTVVRVGKIYPHPGADTLCITNVFDYNVVIKSGSWEEGQLAVYVPIDSIVPDTNEWAFMIPRDHGAPRAIVGQVPEKYRIIEAKKIRGAFSQGILAPLPAGDWNIGDNVASAMGITKYDPVIESSTKGDAEKQPVGWKFHEYTDLEGIRRYPNALNIGEEVIVTEKIHGCNTRYVHDGTRLWSGSHRVIRKKDLNSTWWKIAKKYDLEEKMSQFPMHIICGEIYGNVKGIDLKYGIKNDVAFMVFDIFDIKQGTYLNHDDAYRIAHALGLTWVPILYRGPWVEELNELHAEGNSTLANHVREGFVVKPIVERTSDMSSLGDRVILKRHGTEFLLRKGKS